VSILELVQGTKCTNLTSSIMRTLLITGLLADRLGNSLVCT